MVGRLYEFYSLENKGFGNLATFHGPAALATIKGKAQADGVNDGLNDGVSEGVNILNRLTFYDVDSKLLDIELDEDEKKKYLKKIIGDWNYFKKSLSRADLQVNIENVALNLIPGLIVEELNKIDDGSPN